MKERIYNQWAGNEKGKKENLSKCIEKVWPPPGYISSQCSRKRGYGPEGLYCKQHAKVQDRMLSDKLVKEENYEK